MRVELGVKDLEKGSVLVARRDTGAKEVVPWADLPSRAPALLEQIQARGPFLKFQGSDAREAQGASKGVKCRLQA